MVQHFGKCVFKCFLSNKKSDEKIDTASGLFVKYEATACDHSAAHRLETAGGKKLSSQN